ncbi:arabinose-5-phosphate isomerase [Litorimonas taeanensis]|uniref:Arabinose-5-phosphate isomerase n=1 Tax=Litorimonas taeanensis TaxID=568099 RepID=A0A420WDY3_9PROT|nr:KpsF/GutQ family sugar-phosphate isomerase [Litorimonas taeanensis]RKQ69196.1 arabinose-5-phosphate isomerase [Litorimonas taeanensis]
MSQPDIKQIARDVLTLEADAIRQMSEDLSDSFSQAVSLLLNVQGRIIVSGMGKSGHIGRKFAATLASTGAPAYYVHPSEASHGDLGMIAKIDCVVLISNSGETKELADIMLHAKRFGIKVIGITRNHHSTLGQQSDIVLRLPDAAEACSIGMAPTTSTTCTLALTDALAITLMKIRGFDADNFRVLHPGGRLGAALVTASQIMHKGDLLPLLSPDAPMEAVLLEMTSKGFGVAAVADEGKLLGIITDGDLRRNMSALMTKTAGEVATPNPHTISPDSLASEALGLMNSYRITAFFVVDTDDTIQGLLTVHDCLRIGLG